MDFIYDFIIGESFLELDSLFTEIKKFFDFENIIDVSAVILAYSMVIMGAIGYNRSILRRGHRGILGNIRFVVDLFILFLMYYLIRLANPDGKVTYAETFLWLLPLIFLVFTFWDFIKFLEYRNDIELHVEAKRTFITAIFGIVFVVLGYSYYHILKDIPINADNFWSNKIILDPYFIVISFIVFFLYRMTKWREEPFIPQQEHI